MSNMALIKKRISATIVVAAAFFLGFETYTIALVHFEGKTGLPENLGNSERIRSSLREHEPKENFSFAVVGDTGATSTFERLCDKLREEPLSFLVMNGDFVESPTRGNHDYFRLNFPEKCKLNCPVFLIAGNRDVANGEMDRADNEVLPTDFERMYGPTNFFFEYGGCLFIGLCTLPPPYSTKESLAFLDSTLAKYRTDGGKVFVFTHMPLIKSAGTVTNAFENVQDFINVIDRYKVDYVITAHFHGYNRVKIKDTVYLINGGGGAPLDEKVTFGGLHHGIIFTVNHGAVSERVVLVRHAAGIADIPRHFAITQLFPVLVKHVSFTIAENTMIIGILLVCLWNIIHLRKNLVSKNQYM